MSLPRYPEYKDSGVEWLGEVPGHWAVKPVKAVATCNDEVLGKSTTADYEIEYVEISGVDAGRGITSTDIIPFGDAPSRARRRVQDGDVLVSTVRTYLRAVAPVNNPPGNMIASTGFAVIRPRIIAPHFLGYLFQAEFVISEVIARSVGVSYPAINASDLMRVNVPIPLAEEQQTIATFLDCETGKIDALIAEQQRLVELLAEKRQAVISHAVTKGLPPNAPMKDSGIEWLGEVPEHWEVPYFCFLISNAELGENHDSAEGNEGVPVMKMGNIDRGFVKLHKVEYLPEGIDISESMFLKDGDFLFNTRNSLDLVGKVAIWRGELLKATYNSNILRIVFNSSKVATSAFMNYFFNSDLGLSQLRSLAKGTTSVAAIYYKDLTSLRVMLPPPAEQYAIVTHLDIACAQFDTLTSEANRAITLLQERRSALISAAVTGKIDVRGIKPHQNIAVMAAIVAE